MLKLGLSKSKYESQDKINFYDFCKIEKTENDGEIKFTVKEGKTIIQVIVFALQILRMTVYSKLFLEKVMNVLKKMEILSY